LIDLRPVILDVSSTFYWRRADRKSHNKHCARP